MPVLLPPPIKRHSPYASPRSGGGAGRLLFLLALLAGACSLVWWQVDEDRRTNAYDGIIREVAQRHRIPPAMVKAVIRKESKFKSWVVGKAGEIGLMQIMPGVVKDWERLTHRQGTTNAQLFDPRLNIEIGTWYLARARTRWQTNPDREVLALAQYNAGIVNAFKWSQLPPPDSGDPLERIRFPSTRAYIKRILEYQKGYESQFPTTEQNND